MKTTTLSAIALMALCLTAPAATADDPRPDSQVHTAVAGCEPIEAGPYAPFVWVNQSCLESRVRLLLGQL